MEQIQPTYNLISLESSSGLKYLPILYQKSADQEEMGDLVVNVFEKGENSEDGKKKQGAEIEKFYSDFVVGTEKGATVVEIEGTLSNSTLALTPLSLEEGISVPSSKKYWVSTQVFLDRLYFVDLEKVEDSVFIADLKIMTLYKVHYSSEICSGVELDFKPNMPRSSFSL